MITMTLKVCEWCLKEYSVKLTLVKQGRSLFCSKSCANFNRWKDRPKAHEILFKNINIASENDCWVYKGNIKRGYGSIYSNGHCIGAHRVSYQYHKGEIPESMFICHACDNKLCVNPKHLFIGTPLDNMRDKIQKGRSNYALGSNTGSPKLTETQVKEIKLKLLQNLSIKCLSEEYNVCRETIRRIKIGRRWSHITI
jgi:hypothetical protein